MTTSTESPKIIAWARVYPTLKRSASKTLRRGKWYPVLKDEEADRVTLHMGGRPVDVPRRLLEVRRDRPQYFSVVTRTEYNREPGRPSIHGLGKTYVVCPRCAHRFPLFGRPDKRSCPECGHQGDVGWWDA